MGITGKNRRKIVLTAIVIAIVLSGYVAYRLSLQNTGSPSQSVSTFPVRRGDLMMSVTESGTIKARNAVEIKSKVEGEATILSLVPEGSDVTAEDVANGKVLVELDSSRLRDNMNQQQITFNSAEADYTDAKESLIIQKNQNDSDIQLGLMNLKFAKMDLQKYLGQKTADKMVAMHGTDPNQRPDITTLLSDPNQLGGESLQNYRALTSAIDLAEEDYKKAYTDLGWTEKLFEKEYVSLSDLDTDRLRVHRLEVNWEQAKTSLDLFARYEFPKRTEELFSGFLEAERQLERIYAQTRSRLAQAQARLSSSEARYLLNKEQLERIEKQIEACTMRATEPGLVIYASSSGRRWSGSRTNIEVGENIRERELIMTITNANEMDVDVKVHETNVDKVKVGQPANIVIDAQPDKVFTGEVLKIAPLPDPQSFFGNPDLKVYTTDVGLEAAGESIKPGMNARVEILIAELEDVLSIPIQCVTNRGGNKVCYLMTNNGPKEQVVQTGVFNDRFVEIRDGLQEGQQVLLSPPRLMMGANRSQNGKGDTPKSKAGFKKNSKTKSPPTATAPEDPKESSPKAQASDNSGDAADPMKRMDKNGDGKIDLSSEVPEQARQFMTPLDTNKDGFIVKKEMDAAAKKFGGGKGQPGGGRPGRPQGGQGKRP
ncbi:MAG: efflux RND transporter periplasmic adaptor subunit [Planctomycetota bacterium]|jgi:HlyD family secretion protein